MTQMLQPQPDRKILVVDDEDGIRLTLTRLLARLPAPVAAQIETAGSAEEALGLLEKKRYALVLTDFNMGGKDGIQLLRDVRSRWPDTIRLLMTGYTDEAIFESAREQGGVAACIRKPWDNRQLLATVSDLLEQS